MVADASNDSRAIADWDGAGDAEGELLPVTPEGLDALQSLWPIFAAFNLQYVSRGMLLDVEKNASTASLIGTSAGATATARPAKRSVRTAPCDRAMTVGRFGIWSVVLAARCGWPEKP